jgi:hypothetical protein
VLRFHLDENVDFAIADGLIRRGLSCTRTPPDMPKGSPDEEQLAYCFRERRVIISNDEDMLILSAGGHRHFGIAYYYQGTRTLGQLIARLASISHEMDPEQMEGRVEYL